MNERTISILIQHARMVDEELVYECWLFVMFELGEGKFNRSYLLVSEYVSERKNDIDKNKTRNQMRS